MFRYGLSLIGVYNKPETISPPFHEPPMYWYLDLPASYPSIMIVNMAFENKYPLFFNISFFSSNFTVNGLSIIGYEK